MIYFKKDNNCDNTFLTLGLDNNAMIRNMKRIKTIKD